MRKDKKSKRSKKKKKSRSGHRSILTDADLEDMHFPPQPPVVPPYGSAQPRAKPKSRKRTKYDPGKIFGDLMSSDSSDDGQSRQHRTQRRPTLVSWTRETGTGTNDNSSSPITGQPPLVYEPNGPVQLPLSRYEHAAPRALLPNAIRSTPKLEPPSPEKPREREVIDLETVDMKQLQMQSSLARMRSAAPSELRQRLNAFNMAAKICMAECRPGSVARNMYKAVTGEEFGVHSLNRSQRSNDANRKLPAPFVLQLPPNLPIAHQFPAHVAAKHGVQLSATRSSAASSGMVSLVKREPAFQSTTSSRQRDLKPIAALSSQSPSTPLRPTSAHSRGSARRTPNTQASIAAQRHQERMGLASALPTVGPDEKATFEPEYVTGSAVTAASDLAMPPIRSDDVNSMHEMEPSYIGSLVMYRSGKVKLKIGSVLFDVTPAASRATHSVMASVDAQTQQYVEIDNIGGSFVTSLDVTEALKQKKTRRKHTK
jgi:RNA polymerase III RPC4